jgi:hypothetical protein
LFFSCKSINKSLLLSKNSLLTVNCNNIQLNPSNTFCIHVLRTLPQAGGGGGGVQCCARFISNKIFSLRKKIPLYSLSSFPSPLLLSIFICFCWFTNKVTFPLLFNSIHIINYFRVYREGNFSHLFSLFHGHTLLHFYPCLVTIHNFRCFRL